MQTWRSATAQVGLLGFLVLAACSSASPGPYASTDEYCAARAKAECSIASLCAVTDAACETARQSVCASDVAAAVAAGRKYTSANVQACIDKTNTVYALRVIAPTDQAALTDTCERIFQGSAAVNEACTSDYDCAGTLICDPTFLVCAVSVPTALNSPCGNPGDICAEDSYCAVSSTNSALHVCQPAKTSGEACDAADPCIDTLICETTCVARQLAGQGCTSDGDCDPSAPYCDPGAPVSGSTGSCDAGIIFSPTQPVCAQYGK